MSAKTNAWVPLASVLEVINASQVPAEIGTGFWRWYYNTRCKYINLRIDMRDAHCLIQDRDGHSITLEQLQHQIHNQPIEDDTYGEQQEMREAVMKDCGLSMAATITSIDLAARTFTLDNGLTIVVPSEIDPNAASVGDWVFLDTEVKTPVLVRKDDYKPL